MQGLKFEDDEVIATIQASPGRRILGIGSLWLLSLMVIYVAVVRPPEIGWQLFLFILGAGSIWIAEKMRRATALTLELTPKVLRDSSGAILTKVADIQSLDRGVFAFKPSNGFLLRLSKSSGRSWRPGLWWRLGNRVGVGGMTPGHQAKFMAEILSAMIAERVSD
ncbi:MAG: hypothetical protein AAGK77_02255 [Pseudomonadota bacterium]